MASGKWPLFQRDSPSSLQAQYSEGPRVSWTVQQQAEMWATGFDREGPSPLRLPLEASHVYSTQGNLHTRAASSLAGGLADLKLSASLLVDMLSPPHPYWTKIVPRKEPIRQAAILLASSASLAQGQCGSPAQLLHLLVQQAVEQLLGEDLAVVQARLVAQPLPDLRQHIVPGVTSEGLSTG